MHNLAFLSNLGGPDLLVILLIVLVLFGAKRLPELARGMGQAMREFHKAKDDIVDEVRSVDQTRTPVVREPENVSRPPTSQT